MVSKRMCALWAALALATSASGLSAQQRASVTGRVTDQAGTPIEGVQVILTHLGTSAERGAFTREGRFALTELRAGGPYRLEARMIGYGLGVVNDITLTEGEARAI